MMAIYQQGLQPWISIGLAYSCLSTNEASIHVEGVEIQRIRGSIVNWIVYMYCIPLPYFMLYQSPLSLYISYV